MAVLTEGCFESNYLMSQASGQLNLLRARRKVVDVLGDPQVEPATKAKLKLAMEAREFGIRILGLRGGDAYTRFLDTRGAPIAWNVSAAPKDKLRPHVHRFPITGAVPYLGFFREADARKEEKRLQALGFDTYVRPVSGYSTLGITSDPIYSSMLEGGEARIVEVMLHEMLHGTLYLSGHSAWNESLATFVGYHGAALFFLRDGGKAQKILDDARRRQESTAKFSRFLEPFLRELETLYASPRSREEKLRLREEVFARIQTEFVLQFPPPPGRKPGAFATEPLNNAVLVAHAVYHRSSPDHDRIFEKLGRDLAAFVRLYKHAVDDKDDPIGYLKEYRRGR
jgi:predicted aminopeptidase